MSSGKEIISFQFGHYSNFVGAHWWNIQENGFNYNPNGESSEINHNILFREGNTTRNEVTFTPRLLLVDLKGSLSHLSEDGELYDRPDDPTAAIVEWPETSMQVIEAPKASKNQYLEDLDAVDCETDDKAVANYELDEVVHVWSDYLRTRYHPRTVNVTSEYQHNSDSKPFDVFQYGSNLWKTEPYQDRFTDLIRNYAEECDNMQGFHVLLDGTDGFAGLGTSAIEYLQDEYASKSVLAFPTIPSAVKDSTSFQDGIRSLNLALGFQSLAEHSSLFVPLCTGSTGWKKPGTPRTFPYIKYNEQLPYHSSAVLAAALDTISLRYRISSSEPSSLSDMTNSLSYLGRKAAAASLGLPFAMQRDGYLFDTLEKLDGPLWQCLSPNVALEDDHMWIQSVTIRGVPLDKLRNGKTIVSRDQYQGNNPAYSCTTREEMLRLYLAFNCYSTATHVTASNSSMKVTPPFPRIFTPDVDAKGTISPEQQQEQSVMDSVPAIAGLHSCRGVGQMLELLHKEVSKVPIGKRQHFLRAGLEEDEYKECLDRILTLRECYLEDFE